MAQKALFFTTNGTGDGATEYTQAELFNWVHRSFGEGILRGYLNELQVTNVGRTCTVATGAANIRGAPYLNDTPVTVTLPVSTIGTTGHRIVLRKNYAGQTIRVLLLSSSDGVGTAPSFLQAAGVTWDFSLCTATVTTGGDVTINDTRTYATANSVAQAINLGASSVTTAALNDNAVTLAKLAHPPKVQLEGDNKATINLRMQTGSFLLDGSNMTGSVVFPNAFGDTPLMLLNLRYGEPPDVEGRNQEEYDVYPVTVSGFTVTKMSILDHTVTWLALGPGTGTW